jgi:phospholipase/carboxylesterase
MTRPIIVALHGVGASADDLKAALQPLEAVADIVALPGPDPFDRGGTGRQWFSISGVTEANRPERVAAALPPLLARLEALATERGVPSHKLILLGFSQGAIMTLAAVAGGFRVDRAIAVAGRLAAPVQPAAAPVSVLLVHDQEDQVMPVSLSARAAAALTQGGHKAEAITTSGLGHRIGAPTISAILDWLK